MVSTLRFHLVGLGAAALLACVTAGCSDSPSDESGACAVGEQCACFADSDCPDPSRESCNVLLGVCMTLDAGSTTDAEEDTADADGLSSDSDLALDTSDAAPDASAGPIRRPDDMTDRPVQEQVESVAGWCSAYCGVADRCEELGLDACAGFCGDIEGLATEVSTSETPATCLRALGELTFCISRLACGDVLAWQGGGDAECGAENDAIVVDCEAFLENSEGSSDGSGETEGSAGESEGSGESAP